MSAKHSGDFRSRILLVLLYSATFAVVASALYVHVGFPLDDSYIYQTLARFTGTPGTLPPYVLGQPLAGATSFLWLGMQAACHHMLPALDPVIINAAFSWFLLVVIGQLLWSISSDASTREARWLLAATPALCGNLLWLGMIGMEHLLFLLLSLLCITLWFSGSRLSMVLCGVTAGAITLVRPEAGLLGLLLILTSRYKRLPREVFRFSVPWLSGALALAVCNVLTTGSVLPSTLRGRSWMWFRTEHGAHSLRAVSGFFGQWLRRLPQLFALQFAAIQIRLTRADWFYTLVAVLLAALFLTGAITMYRQLGMRGKLLLLWVALHTGTYLVLFPASGHGGRYQPGLLLLAFPFIFSAALLTLRSIFPYKPVLQRVLLTAVILCSGAFSLMAWRTISILGIAHIRATHGAMAAWIQTHLPPDTRIATFDSGDIAYILHRPVTDLGGLMDRNYVPYLESNTVPRYLRQIGVSYIVLPRPEKEKDGLHLLQGQNKQLLVTFCNNSEDWAVAYAFTAHAWRCQEFYKLNAR